MDFDRIFQYKPSILGYTLFLETPMVLAWSKISSKYPKEISPCSKPPNPRFKKETPKQKLLVKSPTGIFQWSVFGKSLSWAYGYESPQEDI